MPFVNSSSQQSGRLHPQASRATILSWVESKQVTRSHSFGRQFHRNVLTREVSPDSVLDTRAGNARPRVYDRDVMGSRRFRQRRRRTEGEEKPRRLVQSIDNPFPFPRRFFPPFLPSSRFLKVRSSISLKFSVDHQDDPGIRFPSAGFRAILTSGGCYFSHTLHTANGRAGHFVPVSFPPLLSKLTVVSFLFSRVIAENVREPLKRAVD